MTDSATLRAMATELRRVWWGPQVAPNDDDPPTKAWVRVANYVLSSHSSWANEKSADRLAREDAARIAEEWVKRATPFPRYYRYHNECSRAHDEQIAGLGDAIRASITTDEGK